MAAANADLETRNMQLDQALSQLREAQDQLVAQQKLREMVDLASGVVHEIRNQPNSVVNFCDGSAELLFVCRVHTYTRTHKNRLV